MVILILTSPIKLSINGVNPFIPIKLHNEHLYHRKFTLSFTSWECCTSDKNFIIIEDISVCGERNYFFVDIEEVPEHILVKNDERCVLGKKIIFFCQGQDSKLTSPLRTLVAGEIFGIVNMANYPVIIRVEIDISKIERVPVEFKSKDEYIDFIKLEFHQMGGKDSTIFEADISYKDIRVFL